jgi:hypothetical protein
MMDMVRKPLVNQGNRRANTFTTSAGEQETSRVSMQKLMEMLGAAQHKHVQFSLSTLIKHGIVLKNQRL